MAVSPKGGIMKLTKRGIAVRNTAVILVGLFIWETIGGAVAAESPQPEVQVIVTEAKPKTIEFPLDAWSPATAKAYARFALEEYGWDEAQFECVHALWTRESNWRWKAKSPTSDYGIPQRHMSKNSQRKKSRISYLTQSSRFHGDSVILTIATVAPAQQKIIQTAKVGIRKCKKTTSPCIAS
jgi:hypothetical protein